MEDKKKKLIWKGTIGEAIKEGRLTQQEVDKWNCDDDEEAIYNEGYQKGIQQGRTQQKIEDLEEFKKMIEELPKYLLMSKKGEWGVSVEELKSQLEKEKTE